MICGYGAFSAACGPKKVVSPKFTGNNARSSLFECPFLSTLYIYHIPNYPDARTPYRLLAHMQHKLKYDNIPLWRTVSLRLPSHPCTAFSPLAPTDLHSVSNFTNFSEIILPIGPHPLERNYFRSKT